LRSLAHTLHRINARQKQTTEYAKKKKYNDNNTHDTVNDTKNYIVV